MDDNSFLSATQHLEAPIVDLLESVITDDNHKIQHRLKAAELVLARRVPTLQSTKIESVTPTNIFFVSPQELAKRRLAGETSLPKELCEDAGQEKE